MLPFIVHLLPLARGIHGMCASSHAYRSVQSSWLLPLEILFGLFYAVICASCIATTKFRRVDPRNIVLSVVEAIVVLLLFFDPIFAMSRSNRSGGVQIRFGVPFRPVLIILWSRRIKDIISEVIESCRSLKFMAILTLAWLAISSMLIVQNVRGECGYGDGNRQYLYPDDVKESCATLMQYFDNSLVGIIAVFVLLTGEIYSIVTLALFDIPGQGYVFIIFSVWTLISYFVLLALVLAIIFNAYKDAKRATLVHQSDTLDAVLIDAFEIIANPKNWTVEYEIYAKFMQCLQVSFVFFNRCALCCVLTSMQPDIDSKTVRLYWKNHEKVKVSVSHIVCMISIRRVSWSFLRLLSCIF
jgi:hypothetical protein